VVAPVVDALGPGLRQLRRAEERLAVGPEDPQDLGLRHARRLARGHEGIGQVVGEVDSRQVPLLDEDPPAVQAGGIGGAAGGFRFGGARELEVDDRLACAGEVEGQLAVLVAQDDAHAALAAEAFDEARGLRRRGRLAERRRQQDDAQ
jgi:hypothetical protein